MSAVLQPAVALVAASPAAGLPVAGSLVAASPATASSATASSPADVSRTAGAPAGAPGLNRRSFISQLGAAGALLVVGSKTRIVSGAEAEKYGAEGMPHGTVDNPLVFIAIGDDGIVTRSEEHTSELQSP